MATEPEKTQTVEGEATWSLRVGRPPLDINIFREEKVGCSSADESSPSPSLPTSLPPYLPLCPVIGMKCALLEAPPSLPCLPLSRPPSLRRARLVAESHSRSAEDSARLSVSGQFRLNATHAHTGITADTTLFTHTAGWWGR